MEEQKRHSGFETMRILSMVMIVLMHGIGHGGLGSAAPQGSAAFWIYWLLFILARVSTNCFVMLSGYYLSERKGPVHVGRLFRIGAQVWFYSMLTFCVAVQGPGQFRFRRSSCFGRFYPLPPTATGSPRPIFYCTSRCRC